MEVSTDPTVPHEVVGSFLKVFRVRDILSRLVDDLSAVLVVRDISPSEDDLLLVIELGDFLPLPFDLKRL